MPSNDILLTAEGCVKEMKPLKSEGHRLATEEKDPGPGKDAIVISDLHLGSRHCLHGDLERFIKAIPPGCELVLNGDIITKEIGRLPLPHKRILHRIEKQSYIRKIVWVPGNHERGFLPDSVGRIVFSPAYHIQNRLLIAHGHLFDEIMPHSQLFMRVFGFLHNLRIALGARPVHVAQYAKKWKALYGVLRKNVMKNAVSCAKELGYAAVVCGHTHYPEDRVFGGVRYINTGSWTEYPLHYLWVTADTIALKPVTDDSFPQTGLFTGEDRDLQPILRQS